MAERQRLNKLSFQLTDEQVAWLEARTKRLGLASTAEGLRDAIRVLMDAERQQQQARRRAS